MSRVDLVGKRTVEQEVRTLLVRFPKPDEARDHVHYQLSNVRRHYERTYWRKVLALLPAAPSRQGEIRSWRAP